ncbi:hypothetical protein FF38_09776 [Lucilia cuprina]|uniref:Uncharacterized protein n=1 Tax=Lucilia cuprina TaxID=7375 RepID=A0A0L0BR32_LUCCU|nr:hypothetical protein FF38_09776 [Lucilia cuprina]
MSRSLRSISRGVIQELISSTSIRERQSGTIFREPLRCSILKSYRCNFRLHRAKRPLKSFWDISHFNEEWSVNMRNGSPSIYGLKRFTHTTAAIHSSSVTLSPSTETLAPESNKPINVSPNILIIAKGRSSDPCNIVEAKSLRKCLRFLKRSRHLSIFLYKLPLNRLYILQVNLTNFGHEVFLVGVLVCFPLSENVKHVDLMFEKENANPQHLKFPFKKDSFIND